MHSDLNKKFESAREQKRAFCIWRYPGESGIHVAGPAPEKIWDGSFPDAETFVFAPFNLNLHPVLMIGEGGRVTVHTEPKPPVHTEKKHFLAWARKAIDAIRSGKFQKIVAARVLAKDQPDFDPFRHFLALCEKYPETFCYLWFSPSSGTWLGASPELLLERKEDKLRSMALAGTRTGAGEAFGIKEKEEQYLVLDYLKNVFNPWLVETKIVEQTRVHSGHLQHLKNEVRGTLKEKQPDMGALITQIHPTPAVAGLPKSEAMQFIDKEEGMDRSYYSGFLGTLSHDSCRLFVNLRCMQILNNTQFIYAGAGLTAASDPEREWMETEEKTKVVILL
ncbi:MAG: chorismate-binding protein [Bacteroidia bacterium]